ncbi:MAG: helix-hairpin-helix domain-containing protein [Saprospiraceae bacterium]
MFFLISLCSVPWWLMWLLPFLIGLLLGWLIWGRYQRLLRQAEEDLAACRKKSKQLEDDLAECRKAYTSLENENATLRGRIREMEAAASKPKASLASAATGAISALAATGEVKRGSSNRYAAFTEDNLQVIEGIGPKMDEVLKANAIRTWGQLAAQTPEGLRAILDKSGSRYQIIDPTTWPDQAALANKGAWDDLIAMQKSLDTGRDTNTGQTDSKVEKLLIKMGLLRKFAKDDLKIVEGIGPKIEGLLHDAGIKTWEALANTSVDKIQQILDAAGDRYNLADPGTWPKQARLAHESNWVELDKYQEYLQGGKES